MAIYVGGTKCNIFLDGIMYDMELYASIPITNGIRLLSLDDYTLIDTKHLYLTLEKNVGLLSSDNYVLKDIEGLYLTAMQRKGE